jgi:hypothetical protein
VKQEVPRAISLYEKAAGLGSKAAQYYLGNCYRFGAGVPQNLIIGESYYLKKVLADVGMPSAEMQERPSDPWVVKAAREYGVILWSRGRADDFKQAERWVSWAAKYGDPDARKILRQMIKTQLNPDAPAPDLCERESDPAEDALAKRRGVGVCYSYLLEDVDDLYGKHLNFRPVISQVFRPRKRSNDNLVGGKPWEMAVECAPPAPNELGNVNGTILLGVEFTDKDSGEKYWALETVDNKKIAFQNVAVTITMSIRVPADKVSVDDWFVLYGDQPGESPVLAVWESRLKSAKMDEIERAFLSGQSEGRLAASIQTSLGTREDANRPGFDDGGVSDSSGSDTNSLYNQIIDIINIFN